MMCIYLHGLPLCVLAQWGSERALSALLSRELCCSVCSQCHLPFSQSSVTQTGPWAQHFWLFT